MDEMFSFHVQTDGNGRMRVVLRDTMGGQPDVTLSETVFNTDDDSAMLTWVNDTIVAQLREVGK